MRSMTKRRRRGALGVANAMLIALLVLAAGLLPAVASGQGDAAGTAGPVRLLRADGEGVQLALSTPAFELASTADAGGCQQVQAAGFAQSEEVGRPQLPVKVVLLGVPPDAELSLDVEASPARRVASGVALCTAQPVRQAEGEESAAATAQDLVMDASVYSVDAFYPAEAVRLVDLGFARSQRIVRLEFFPLRYNPVTGELRAVDQVAVSLRYGRWGALAPSAQVAGVIEEPAAFETALERSLINYEAARSFRSVASPVATGAAAASWIPPNPGYKVFVREEGIYQLTRTDLVSAGLPVDELDPQTIRMFVDGAEMPVRVTGEEDGSLDEGDVILFYGLGADTRYTDTNVYWLTYGGAAGLRMDVRPSLGGGPLATSFFSSVKREDNLVYDSDLPELPGYDHWWGQQIQAVGVDKTGSTNVSLATSDLAPGTLNASVSVLLGGVTTGPHHVRLYINPATHPDSVWNGIWDGATVHLISATFPQSYLTAAGNNSVKIELINDTPGRAADIVRVDWVRLGYQRSYVAANDKLIFGGDATSLRRYSVAGFSTADVELYDITDPVRPSHIDWTTEIPAILNVYLPLVGSSISPVAAASGGAAPAHTLQFGDRQDTPRRYLAQTPGRRLTPLRIEADRPSDLHSTSNGADYIVISHADFLDAIQPLAAHRAAEGLRVAVVDVQDVYDEFGGGLMSAEAIRDFIAYAYGNWAGSGEPDTPAPASVLLVGDGTYDFRQYRNTVPTFLPPYLDMVDPDAGETATDNRFVAVTRGPSGYDILPDLDIGRLPANTPAEVTAMVNKILGYEAQAPADWMKQVLFVSDDLEGGGGDFYAYSDGIADGYATHEGSEVKILPAGYTPNKVYLGRTCDLSNPATSIECRSQVIDKINTGSLMVSYVGHGLKTYWATEHLYDAAALGSLSNAGRLPVMLPMTCNEGYFIDPTESSLSELGVRAENKGAIASWAPTGYGLAPGHDYLERGLFLGVFYDGQTLGRAATAAKLYLVANAPPGQYLDLVDTFLLLGDPALQVP